MPSKPQAESESGPKRRKCEICYGRGWTCEVCEEWEDGEGYKIDCKDCKAFKLGAASRDARVKALTDALKWALDWIADGTDASEGETPTHDCDFSSNPENGACDFHKKYFESVATLSDGEKTGGKP